MWSLSISQASPRLQSQRLGIMDFRSQHQWASTSRLLMTAFNLCRGPVNGSQSVCECVCLCVCVCLYKTHSLQTERASASFSCGCLRVTSPVNPAGHSFYTAALSTLHFPTQHAPKPRDPVHSTKLPRVSTHTNTHAETVDDMVRMHEHKETQVGIRTCRIFPYTHPRLSTNKQKGPTWCGSVCQISRR